MNAQETDLIRRALELLHQLLPDAETHADAPAPRRCPVVMFAKSFLQRDPASDVTSAELWQFFGEVAASGELEPLPKSEFLRRLPSAMETVFGVRKSHDIQRGGGRVRGFKSVKVREEACCVTPLASASDQGITRTHLPSSRQE